MSTDKTQVVVTKVIELMGCGTSCLLLLRRRGEHG
jgi:hypothetical protein